jgi:hypothetical protein
VVAIAVLVIVGILIGWAIGFFIGFLVGRSIGGKKPGAGFPVIPAGEIRDPSRTD